MTPIGKFTKTAIAVTVAGALVAPATAAFAGEKTERAILGAVIGGVAGMLLASRLASHKQTLNRIFAVLIFAVAIYVLYRSGTTLFA